MKVFIQVYNIYIDALIFTFIPTSLCYEYFLYIPWLPRGYCFRKIPYESSYRVPHMPY